MKFDWDLYAIALPYLMGGYGLGYLEALSAAVSDGVNQGGRLVRRGGCLAMRFDVPEAVLYRPVDPPAWAGERHRRAK